MYLDMVKEYLINLLSRKFLFALTIFGGSSGLVYLGKLPAEQYKDLNMVVVGAYMASNVTTRQIKRRENENKIKAAIAAEETEDALEIAKPMGLASTHKGGEA